MYASGGGTVVAPWNDCKLDKYAAWPFGAYLFFLVCNKELSKSAFMPLDTAPLPQAPNVLEKDLFLTKQLCLLPGFI
jgi:hypothetical protein